MEPSRTGAAHARRVVLSTPTAPVNPTHGRAPARFAPPPDEPVR